VISYHSRDIGVVCLLFGNTIRMMDEVMCNIMTRKVTPSMLIKVDKVAVCGSGG
jgi:hypothetical protein